MKKTKKPAPKKKTKAAKKPVVIPGLDFTAARVLKELEKYGLVTGDQLDEEVAKTKRWVARADALAREKDKLAVEVERLREKVEKLSGIEPELPPRPPYGNGTPRYGLRWNGPEQPVAVPMDDGYWTPYHLVEKAEEEWERACDTHRARRLRYGDALQAALEALASISLMGNDNTAPAHTVLKAASARAHEAANAARAVLEG